ncbi:MAG TPA: translational GTPase TypA [Clostridiaceae bacterium]|nr:translational GTPase TypA [Clostridiaceae bacterium]
MFNKKVTKEVQIENLRNVAIIAHVDHGKTTLVDAMLRQSGTFHEHQHVAERVMDSKDIERERGITILAKNTAIQYGNIRINIVDTPGHADFGGEVERILKMVDGVLLVVDAYDGPMPQTRFVLKKALELKLQPIVVINKIDRRDARPVEAVDMVLDLFIELGADDDQLEFPVLYANARDGLAGVDLTKVKEGCINDIRELLDCIVEEIPCPVGDPTGSLQLLVSNLDYDPYIGQLGIGRIMRGHINEDDTVSVTRYGTAEVTTGKVSELLRFEGLERVPIQAASVGEIVCVAGLEEVEIGSTINLPGAIDPLPFVKIDEPTISMQFSVNDSPFAGQDGKYLTSRHLRDRLFKEIKTNVSMQVETTDSPDVFIVKGRGELHLSILIEEMRRQGYEFQVSKPQVIEREVDGVLCEPVEDLFIDVPEEFVGTVIEKLGTRRAELIDMKPPLKGYVRLEFKIPSRGLIGYRTEFLTDTRGNGIMNSIIDGFAPWKGDIETRGHGVIVAWEKGEAVPYGLYGAQDRGPLFIGPGEAVYEGMIVGINPKLTDITVNVCKKKHVTNMRAAGADEALRLTPPLKYSLEQCMEFIAEDELIEITPNHIRMRKRILNTDQRTKEQARQRKQQR